MTAYLIYSEKKQMENKAFQGNYTDKKLENNSY